MAKNNNRPTIYEIGIVLSLILGWNPELYSSAIVQRVDISNFLTLPPFMKNVGISRRFSVLPFSSLSIKKIGTSELEENHHWKAVPTLTVARGLSGRTQTTKPHTFFLARFSTVISNVPEDGRVKADAALFYGHLKRLVPELQQFTPPSIFISYSWDGDAHEKRIETLAADLVETGLPVEKILFDKWWNKAGGRDDIFSHADKIRIADKVILVGSPGLKVKYENRTGVVSQEINALRLRIGEKGTTGIIPVWFEEKHPDIFPSGLQSSPARSLGKDYFFYFFHLIGDLFQSHLLPHKNIILSHQQSFQEMRGNIPLEMLEEYGQKVLAYKEERVQATRAATVAMLDDFLAEHDVKKK